MLSDIEKTKTWQSILLDSMIGIWLTEFKMKILDNESFKIDKINKLKDIDVFDKKNRNRSHSPSEESVQRPCIKCTFFVRYQPRNQHHVYQNALFESSRP